MNTLKALWGNYTFRTVTFGIMPLAILIRTILNIYQSFREYGRDAWEGPFLLTLSLIGAPIRATVFWCKCAPDYWEEAIKPLIDKVRDWATFQWLVIKIGLRGFGDWLYTHVIFRALVLFIILVSPLVIISFLPAHIADNGGLNGFGGEYVDLLSDLFAALWVGGDYL